MYTLQNKNQHLINLLL